MLILALALLAGFLAYQAPPVSDIFVGWLGDRLFLPASQGLGAADAATFYGDEITGDARSGRSRWSRQDIQIDLPGLGAGGDLTLTLRVQGWPNGVLNRATSQPTVDITANGMVVDQFKPTTGWADYSFRIPASVQASDLLSLKLHISDTFTSTAAIADPQRAKGIRLEYIGVRGSEASIGFTLPAALPLGLLALDGVLGLLALLVLTRRPTLAFVLTTLLISSAAIGLALARAWAVALLPWLTLALALLLIYSRRTALLNLFERLLHRYARGVALNYGLVVMVAAWLAYLAARASFFYQLPGLQTFKDSFPDSLLYGLLGMGLLLLIIVRGRTGLPRLSNALVRMFGSRRGARALLTLALLIWISYEAYVVAGLPYVGHADYADNAVVARNLLAGRGWVVDYVTQYYQLYSGVTRPQETWPLLQPVWIVPFFALFGPTAWAAKIPNLLFTAALALLIYSTGARLWDRRVGLTAALIILTNYLFFRLVIYTTSDLAFTVFAFGAIYLFYRTTTDDRRPTNDDRQTTTDKRRPTNDDRQTTTDKRRPTTDDRSKRTVVSGRWSVVGSGVLTGLMLLQKPASGGLIALGMGLWYLSQLWRTRRLNSAVQSEMLTRAKSPLLNFQFAQGHPIFNLVLWGTLALAILSPYLARNIELFHTPFYSTESHDAWVLGYGEWEDIYKVFTTQADLSTAGVPDRSWVLRWGFDRTQQKIIAQIRAMRDYLVPPWKDLPLNLSDQLSGPYSDPLRDPKDPRMLFAMGAWLALLGGISALRSQRRLLALLVVAFVPYVLFLILYWHADEERYFVMLLPWLALLASFALWRGYERVAAIGDGRWTPVGLAMVVTALVLVIQPSWPDIAQKVRVEPKLVAADIDAYTWLRAHSQPDDVVMTRLPWQFNWQTERPALMVPNTTDPQIFLRLARYYNVRYLMLDSAQRPNADVRAMIDNLLDDPQLGFKEEYEATSVVAGRNPITTEVYSFPQTYGGVAALQP
jgi:hypothetical protein